MFAGWPQTGEARRARRLDTAGPHRFYASKLNAQHRPAAGTPGEVFV